MLEHTVISYCRRRMKEDTVLQSILGDFEVHYLVAANQPKFPHITHRIRVQPNNDPVYTANYTVEVLDFTLGWDIIMSAVERICVLFNNHMISEGGGGVRFRLRDRQNFTYDKRIQRASILFAVRGVDTTVPPSSL